MKKIVITLIASGVLGLAFLFAPIPAVSQGISIAGPYATLKGNTFSGSQILCASCGIAFTGKGWLGAGSGADAITVLSAAATNSLYLSANTIAIGTGWGTSPALDGAHPMAAAGSINVGTGGTATTGTLTYTSSGAAQLYCIAQDATTPAKTTSCTATSTTITFTASAAWTASDHIVWHLFGGN